MDENRPKEEMDGIASILEDNKNGKNLILTSVITMAETLAAKLGPAAEAQFQACFKGGPISMISVDWAVSLKARELRDFYGRQKSGLVLSTPDAIHLATAIIHGVNEFHTFDGKNTKKHGEKTLGLLQLNGAVAGHNLTICKPLAKQPRLL